MDSVRDAYTSGLLNSSIFDTAGFTEVAEGKEVFGCVDPIRPE